MRISLPHLAHCVNGAVVAGHVPRLLRHGRRAGHPQYQGVEALVPAEGLAGQLGPGDRAVHGEVQLRLHGTLKRGIESLMGNYSSF